MSDDEWNEWYVKEQIPYVKAPANFWKQMDGKMISMYEMSLDHIRNCIKKIDKDIESSEWTVLSEENKKKMKEKKKELENIFAQKSQF